MPTLKNTARAIEQRVAQKLARGSVVMPLPLYAGEYAGKFRVATPETMDEFEALAQRSDVDRDEANEAGAQFVADSLRYLMARAEPGQPYEKLEHEDGRPVLFDEEFAEALGLTRQDGTPTESMADVVAACWTTEEGEINWPALNYFAIRLLSWMQDTAGPVEGEVVGEALEGRKSSGSPAPSSQDSPPISQPPTSPPLAPTPVA